MTTHKMTIDLFEPGMTPFHRAGLAGLWMTLDRLEQDRVRSNEFRGLEADWHKDDRSVSFQWEGRGRDFFSALLKYAYPITDDGLMYFAALGDPLQHAQESLATHRVMLSTFLQHGRSRKAETGRGTGTLTVQVDGQSTAFRFKRVQDHRFAAAKFNAEKAGEVAGWLFPGGAERHVGLRVTKLIESPGRLLALRFAPIACFFFVVRHRSSLGNNRIGASVVVPEPQSLIEYAQLRLNIRGVSLAELHAAGPADAALKLLGMINARQTARRAQIPRCHVVTFGRVAWSSRQQSRVAVLDTRDIRENAIRTFDPIRRALPARQVRATDSDSESWWDVPQTPEFAAENLLRGKPWWRGFSRAFDDTECRRHILRWETEGLSSMVRNPQVMGDGPEVRFVRACHEAWRRRMGELGERSRSHGTSFSALAERERERLRVRFSRCRTAADLRAAVTDFWSRGGPQAELQENWTEILPFIDGRNWQAGRDLALLSLASYRGPGDQSEATDPRSGK